MTDLTIRPLTEADWPAVRQIYADGIATGDAAYIPEPPTWEYFDRAKDPSHRWLAERCGEVLGWTVISRRSDHVLFRGIAEISLYVAAEARGLGVGTSLLSKLVESTEADGVWTLTSLVFPENLASLALQEKFGFRVVGVFERYAFMSHGPYAGTWRDNTLLERRSRVVAIARPGID